MRVTSGPITRRRHKKLLKHTKGYRHGRKNLIKRGREAFISAQVHAFQDRKKKKSDFRSLWITRINAAVRAINPTLSYSRFVNGLKLASIEVNRKMLAELAINEPSEFAKLVDIVATNG